jgi:short-subunit dehydrogenase
MGGFVPVPGQTIYCASKAAVKMMTEGLAAELAHTKVKVSVVFPGAVATDILTNSGVGSRKRTESSSAKALPAAEAARIIVQGMERGAQRIFAGKDAAFMDKLYRLSPGYAANLIAGKMRSLLPG